MVFILNYLVYTDTCTQYDKCILCTWAILSLCHDKLMLYLYMFTIYACDQIWKGILHTKCTYMSKTTYNIDFSSLSKHGCRYIHMVGTKIKLTYCRKLCSNYASYILPWHVYYSKCTSIIHTQLRQYHTGNYCRLQVCSYAATV